MLKDKNTKLSNKNLLIFMKEFYQNTFMLLNQTYEAVH